MIQAGLFRRRFGFMAAGYRGKRSDTAVPNLESCDDLCSIGL